MGMHLVNIIYTRFYFKGIHGQRFETYKTHGIYLDISALHCDL